MIFNGILLLALALPIGVINRKLSINKFKNVKLMIKDTFKKDKNYRETIEIKEEAIKIIGALQVFTGKNRNVKKKNE